MPLMWTMVKMLWSYELPTGTEGLPAMYEVNGKQYLAVCVSTPLKFGRQGEESAQGAASLDPASSCGKW